MGVKRLRDLRKLLFEHVFMEPVMLGLAKKNDLALIIESSVHEPIFNLCRVATLKWTASKGSNSYYSNNLRRSFVLSVYDDAEIWTSRR